MLTQTWVKNLHDATLWTPKMHHANGEMISMWHPVITNLHVTYHHKNYFLIIYNYNIVIKICLSYSFVISGTTTNNSLLTI